MGHKCNEMGTYMGMGRVTNLAEKVLTLFMDDPKSRRSLVLSLASLAVFFLIAVMTVLSLVRLSVIHEERPRKH